MYSAFSACEKIQHQCLSSKMQIFVKNRVSYGNGKKCPQKAGLRGAFPSKGASLLPGRPVRTIYIWGENLIGFDFDLRISLVTHLPDMQTIKKLWTWKNFWFLEILLSVLMQVVWSFWVCAKADKHAMSLSDEAETVLPFLKQKLNAFWWAYPPQWIGGIMASYRE